MEKVPFSLARRVSVVLAALGILLLGVGVMAFIRLREVDGRYSRLFEQEARGLMMIPRMNVLLHDAARLAAQRANAIAADEGTRVDREFVAVRAQMLQETAALRTVLPEYSKPAAEFERAFESLAQVGVQVRDAASVRQHDQARLLLRTQFLPRFDRLRTFLQALGTQLHERILQESRQAEILSNQVIRRTLLTSVLLLAVGIALGQLWVWWSISRPLHALVGTVRRLMAGDLNLTIPGGGRTDEVGLLASALGMFRQSLVRKQELEEVECQHLERVRQGEAEMANQSSFQRALIDTIPYPVFIKDASARFLGCNRAYEAAFGTTAAAIRGKTVLDLDYLPAPDRERFHAEDCEVIREASRRSYELPIRHADGRTHVALYSVDGFRQADGKPGGLIGLLVDITERKAAEEALRQSQTLLQSVTDNADAFIFGKDLEGRYLFVNRLYMDLLKRPPEEIIGRTVAEVFPDAAEGRFAAGEAEVLASGTPKVAETTMLTGGGETRHFLAHKFPLFDGDGRITGIGGVSTDITEIKRAQEDLRKARDEAEAANRAKSAFVATMSHEIRTPMNSVINLTSLALDSELTPRQRQYISVAHSAARGLLALLNDILDFSKIEAGRLELERAAFPLRRVLEEVADSFRGRVLEKRIEFAAFVSDDVPDALVGDTLRLRQVLINLLGNAFKFTEHGEIVLRVARADGGEPAGADAGSGVMLRFSVRDSGIGIPAEKFPLLFEAFNQADTSTSRKYGGTGLGLAICKRLVALMGGRISVTSEAGRGSEFAFTARFDPAPPGAAGTEATLPRDLQHTRALVVTGSDLTRELLVTSLRRFGLEVDGVETGEIALDRLRGRASSRRPGLLVTDWLLPDLSGIDFVRQVRGSKDGEALPIIMVSAFATEDEERQAVDAGVRAFVPKPITGSMLFDAVIRATQLRPELQAAPATKAAPGNLAGRRILVAEDNEANQFVVREILEYAGATVVVVPNGQGAIDRLEAEEFDLVLMDMQMPEVDGVEATRRIRARNREPRVPIIALTANAMKSDVDACYAAGMDDYLAKPIERTAMFATLAQWLGKTPVSTTSAPSGPVNVNVEPEKEADAAPGEETAVAPEAAADSTEVGVVEVAVEPAEGTEATVVSPALTPVAEYSASGDREGTEVSPIHPHEEPPPAVASAASEAPVADPVSEAPVESIAAELVEPAAMPVTQEPEPAVPAVPSIPSDSTPAPLPDEGQPAPAPVKTRAPRKKRPPKDEPQLDLLAMPASTPGDDVRAMVQSGRLPGIDLEDAVQRLGLPRERIEQMLVQFGRGQGRLLQDLKASLAEGDQDEARRLAHSMAGAAGNLSAHELRRHAKTVELALKFGQGNLDGMIEELEREAARVFGGLQVLDEIRSAAAPTTKSAPAPDAVSGPALREALEELARNLDEGDLDGIQTAMNRLQEVGIPAPLDPDAQRLEELLNAFEHADAAALVRRMTGTTGVD